MSKRPLIAVLAVTALLVGACSSRGTTEGATSSTTPTTAAAADNASFGTLENLCGPGDATIDAAQNAGATDVINVGTATDKGFQVVPGLNIEMEDAAKAFIAWCNEQGGVKGLPLNLVELDAAYFNVPAMMEQACDEVFSMVGGGVVLDDQEFPRFNECGMIDIAGYSVTTTKAMSSGMVQPLPNPSNAKPTGWLRWAAENRPEDVKRTAVMYGGVASIETVAKQDIETMEKVGGYEIVATPVYNPAGESNWAPFAQQLKDANVTLLDFVGQPANLVNLLRAMDEIGYRPNTIIQQSNFYDEVLTEGAGGLADGILVRTFYTPFEDRNVNSAMERYLSNMEKYNPNGKIAGLGLQATSAYLLFVTAANKCAESNGGLLERECVLDAARTITEWDGGGIHAPSNPASNRPADCEMLLEIKDGKFTRLFPARGSSDDNSGGGGGWHCRDNNVVELTGDYGDVNAGVDPNR
jgi:ABC-type branched-subunit amino acid transport system substrate-binding protein